MPSAHVPRLAAVIFDDAAAVIFDDAIWKSCIQKETCPIIMYAERDLTNKSMSCDSFFKTESIANSLDQVCVYCRCAQH